MRRTEDEHADDRASEGDGGEDGAEVMALEDVGAVDAREVCLR